MIELSAVDAAYIAGFIDGEGYIGMRKCPVKHGVRYRARLQIGNTDRAIIEYFKSIFGGTMYISNNNEHTLWKTSYKIEWTGPRAFDILLAVQPFLKVKSRQANLIIEYYRWKDGLPRTGRRYWSYQGLDDFYLEGLGQELKMLNRRGKVK